MLRPEDEFEVDLASASPKVLKSEGTGSTLGLDRELRACVEQWLS